MYFVYSYLYGVVARMLCICAVWFHVQYDRVVSVACTVTQKSGPPGPVFVAKGGKIGPINSISWQYTKPSVGEAVGRDTDIRYTAFLQRYVPESPIIICGTYTFNLVWNTPARCAWAKHILPARFLYKKCCVWVEIRFVVFTISVCRFIAIRLDFHTSFPVWVQ